MKLRIIATVLPLAFLAAAGTGGQESVAVDTAGAGPVRVRFANSCGPEVQADFAHAVTLLHSFEYPETGRLFAEIIERDSGCAMAHWGAAMSLWHPIWAPPAPAELERGAALLAAAEDLPMSARERSFIEALGAFFSSTDPATHRERARAYEMRMSRVYAEHLEDPEAALFYALALLGSADPADKSYANQFKAAAILNWVRSSHPLHPGVLHYLIHSYDFPGLAHLALDAARTYASAAPDSAHAQHMPSHIFTRLGLWEESLSSNHDSIRSAGEYTRRAHLPGHYDEALHSMDYLMYALLQTGRNREAQELLGRLADIERTDTENFKVAYAYAASPARYALERRAWEEASELELVRTSFPWEEFGWAQSIHHFARGLGAARSGQIDKAKQELAGIEAIRGGLRETTLLYWRRQVEVHLEVVRSWILLAEGRRAEALALAATAADREDGVDKHPVTPGEVLPARELYADMLLESGDVAAALEQYQRVLRAAPNRLNALLGLAEAAKRAGDVALADRSYETARAQTRSASW